jgi:hypothetical protein
MTTPPDQPPPDPSSPRYWTKGGEAPPQQPGYPPYGYQGYGQAGSEPPPGHLGWAITALVLFWPLAIAAFINYARVERDFYRGDIAGAQRASRQVRKLGIVALILAPCLLILYVAVVLIAWSNTPCGLHGSC